MSVNLESNPRGIPKAPFVDKVEEFIDENAETTLRKFTEMIGKYKFMESSHLQRKKILEGKIPDLRKTLDMVLYIISKQDSEEDIITNYELNDTIYATAKIKPTKTVYLWLGVNVMLEYTTDEAKTLLEEKLATAEKSLSNIKEDLEFLRNQITTMEVNIARVYNWDVKQRRLKKKESSI
ncbi:Prefoldin, subunit 3 [Piromyces finnis]|uniref:Prefoldin subunit 3 n=1 Tax=Piromyces finnis TaxID=1754191 RepID=A0A1Y1VN17_9FUNG|nr:Prefoldin, subunit 3 [Piromyces finnis]|eukprot:ORX60001.1 Prefoldin, subunit 3 [Piromyces finnis]